MTLRPCVSASSFAHCLKTTWRSAVVEHVGVADVHLVLAETPLALARLHGHAGRLEMATERAGEALRAGALQQLVVLEVPARRTQVGVARRRRLLVRACGTGSTRARSQPWPLRPASAAAVTCRRRIERGATVAQVSVRGSTTSHRTSAVRSSHVAGRSVDEVRHEVEVAVAEVPAGECVARDRLQLHVGGEQVVAGMGAVARDLIEEEVDVDPLAGEAAVVVGEADDDGVDVTASQLVDGEHQRVRTCPPAREPLTLLLGFALDPAHRRRLDWQEVRPSCRSSSSGSGASSASESWGATGR